MIGIGRAGMLGILTSAVILMAASSMLPIPEDILSDCSKILRRSNPNTLRTGNMPSFRTGWQFGNHSPFSWMMLSIMSGSGGASKIYSSNSIHSKPLLRFSNTAGIAHLVNEIPPSSIRKWQIRSTNILKQSSSLRFGEQWTTIKQRKQSEL